MHRYIGADRKGMYDLLSTFDDREMALFEKSIKETVYEDYQAEIGIGVSLIHSGIADKSFGNGFKVKPDCAKIYEYDIKGSEFDEDRKRTSWINRCYRWCSYMGRSFSKEFLLKLINQNRDVQMDENEMMKRLRAFKGSDIVEYNGYIISDYWDEADEDHVDMDIENEIEASAYIPTVQEIDEFYYRGFLFSKPGYQKLYKFFVKVLGNEAKAYMKTLDVWGMFQVLSNPEEAVIELDDGDFTDPDKRKKLLSLLKKAERETNIGHYYGNTIDTAIENELDLKVKYLVPLNEESEKVRKKNKGGKEKMTYEKIVEKVKKALSKADVSEVKEHLAVQVDVYGEGEGAFYIEAKEGKVNVQPYEYFDHDLRIRCTGDEIIALAEGKKKIIDEVNAGNIEALRNVSRLWDFDTALSANKAKVKTEKKAKAVKMEKPAKKEKAINPTEKKVAKADKKVTKKATKEDKKDTKVSEKDEKKAKKTATKEKMLPNVKTIKAVVAGDKKATDKVIGMYEDEILKEMESKLKPLYTHPDGTENETLKAELKKQIEDGLRTELPKSPIDKPVKAEKKAAKAKADKKEAKVEEKDTKKVAKAEKKNEKPDKLTKKADKKVKNEKKSETTKVEKSKKPKKTEKTE